jgi:hypothetical protein
MSKGKSGFIQKRDGNGFILKPGSRVPYRFCCCGDSDANSVHGGCYLTHDLYGEINDDGEIEITVYVNNQVTERARAVADAAHSFTSAPIFQILDSAPPAPRKAQQMRTSTRRRRILDENRDALDENGILKDGHSIRVSMMDAEASRGARRFTITDSDKIAEAIAITKAAMKGTGTAADPYIINTGATQFSDAQLALHKPGYRYRFNDDTVTTEEEHHHTRRKRKTIYRDSEGREAGTAETGDAINETEKAYSEMLDHLHNGWKTPPATDAGVGYAANGYEGMPTRAIPTMPAGAYPLSAGEGNLCSKDGSPGRLKRVGEWLVCETTPVGATRADSAPRVDSMSAEEAQPIRDQAYEQYVNEIRNAWRG